MSGLPRDGIDEAEWLSAFLEVRHQDLLHASDPDTRKAWAQSAGRATALAELVKEKNWDLSGPILLKVDGQQVRIP